MYMYLQTAMFIKTYTWTNLNVRWRGSLRGGFGNTNSWGLWEIQFNGSTCLNPGPIDSMHYNAQDDVSQNKASGSKCW